MKHFSDKLDSLPHTVSLVGEQDLTPLAMAMAAGRSRHAIAVGSGGSAIAAAFFSRCRETVLGRPTSVQTPMQLVLETFDLVGTDIWLFSAGAENPDIIAAVQAARARRAANIHLLTRNLAGTAATQVAALADGHVHQTLVAEPKDGFLATHSLVAATGALLLAADLVSGDSIGGKLAVAFAEAVKGVLSPEGRKHARDILGTVASDDSLLIMSDPQLEPVSLLIETSVWESGLCSVQRTDFRNFAHGRHVWIERRGKSTFVLALSGSETRAIWQSISELLPAQQRSAWLDFGDCGRFRNAVGIVHGLVLVEALGNAVGVDPGKPGIGPFAKPIYEDTGLKILSQRMTTAVRHKRSAVLRRDDPAASSASICALDEIRLKALAAATIKGLVLDYDGTIVTTAARLDPPGVELIDELVRLDAAGLRIAIATGRGGSAGEMLREHLPATMHSRVLMGYYNGGYIRPLDIDITTDKPPSHHAVEEAFSWLTEQRGLFKNFNVKNSGVQITLSSIDLVRPDAFLECVSQCPSVQSGLLKVTCSGHSFDIVLCATSKRSVLRELVKVIEGDDPAILCIGDSGSRTGNDNELLTTEFGISVGDVCGRTSGCWSMFGRQLTGPEALLKILKALKQDESGNVRLDMEVLLST